MDVNQFTNAEVAQICPSLDLSICLSSFCKPIYLAVNFLLFIFAPDEQMFNPKITIMKTLKLLSFMLLAMAFSFCACSKDDEPEPEPTPLALPYFEIDHAVTFLISKEAQKVEVPVLTNLGTLKVDIIPVEANEWIKLYEVRKEEKDERGGEKNTYIFTIKENTENRTRTANIAFKINLPSNTVVFTQTGVE